MNTENSNKEIKSNELYTLLANENFTGFYDDNNQPILVGVSSEVRFPHEIKTHANKV